MNSDKISSIFISKMKESNISFEVLIEISISNFIFLKSTLELILKIFYF